MANKSWLTGVAGDLSPAADLSPSGLATASTDVIINSSNAVSFHGSAVAHFRV